ALAGDLYRGQRRARAMGILEASNGLGKVVSPILGSAAALLAWNAPFYVYPLLAWLSAAGVWLWVSESEAGRRARPFREYVRELGRIFADRGVALAVAFFMGAAVLFMLFGVLSWYSDVLERSHGITGFTKGFVIAVPVLVMAVTSWLTGTYLTERLRRWLKHVAIGGMGLIATALATLYAVRGPVPLTLVVSLLGFGNGLVLPVLNTLITSAAATGERGLVTSLYGTVRFFGAALGPPAFGLLLEAGPLWMFWGSAAVVALIALAGAFWLDAARLLRAGTQPSGRAAAGGTRGRQNRKPPVADAQATRPKPDEPREPDNQRVEPQPELAGRR
ncbi:MAG TPA: MFS transporter, partial [Bacillota bacterium]